MSKKRIIVITGTSRGIGRGLAQHYLKQGDLVCGCSRGSASVRHKNYRHFSLDVAEERAVVAMIRAVVAEQGRIDALVNNAGIAAMNHALLTPVSVARSIFDTNFLGTFLFCREAAKAMLRHKHGRIVNFATVATPLRLEGEAIYAASKAAVESFTQVLARELGQTGVTVNAVGVPVGRLAMAGQVTTLPERVPPPVALTNTAPAGSVSVTTTLVAGLGPLFVAVRV